MKSRWILLSIVCLTISVSAIAQSTQPTTEPVVAGTPVRSEDNTIEIALPAGWKMLNDGQHDEYQMFAGNRAARSTLLIKTFNRDDLPDATLETAIEEASRGFDGPFTDVVSTVPVKLTINRNHAMRREVSGSQANLRWVYQITVVETPKQIVWFFFCTNPSRMPQLQAECDEILRSIKDLLNARDEPSTRESGK